MSDEQQVKEKRNPAFVVGIGASAGGLEAFQELLAHLPLDSGMSFVLISHLDPEHESQLPAILSKATQLPVVEAKNNTFVEPNHVYVLSPRSQMTIVGGVLMLTPREIEHKPPLVIDRFLFSLAKDRTNHAIAVVLSGTGSDGSRGLAEIKAEGGITFAQDKTAHHDSMPQAAIRLGCVDFVLSPEEIARELERLSRHPGVPTFEGLETKAAKVGSEEDIQPILRLLYSTTGVEFARYKQSSIVRRIGRRMLLDKFDNPQDYLLHLKKSPADLAKLHQDLLINVTSFFRDPDVFDALKRDILPRIVKDRPLDQSIRVWVPGCSTGEEVYSIAMCVLEFLAESNKNFHVQIFGTDLSESTVERARRGEYVESAMADVSPERKRRFFVEGSGGYQISKTIRELCVFAKHDITADPPFSSLDLISCRNLLIYLDAGIQKRVLSLFHYALKQSGFLLLGSSEGIGPFGDFFSPLGGKHKLFSKKLRPSPPHFDFLKSKKGEHPAFPRPEEPHAEATTKQDLLRETDRAIAMRLAPNGVIINGDMEILHVRGRTGHYLEAAPGEMSHNILKMARPGLLIALRSAIYKAIKDKAPVRKDEIEVKSNGGYIHAFLEVIPLQFKNSNEQYFAVLFGECRPPFPVVKARGKRIAHSLSRVEELEKELSTTQEYLQSLVEKEQAVSEELKSANEEILSSNEELQSTNEELETAKEELQSINEELMTVNEELKARNQQLTVTNNDLNNLIGAVRVPFLILDRGLCLRRFSPGLETVMKVRHEDVGRPLGDIKTTLEFADLVPLVTKVIDNVTAECREIKDAGGRWFSLWVRPYQTSDNQIDGAVITLFDIDALKRALDYADAVVQTIRESLVVLDGKLRVKSANRCFYDTFGTKPVDTEGKLIYQLANGQWDVPELRALLEKILPEKATFQDFQVTYEDLPLGRREMLLNARQLARSGAEDERILLAIEDVTSRRNAEARVRQTSDELVRLNMELEQFAYVAAHDLQEPLRMVAMYMDLLARRFKDQLGKDGDEYIELAVSGASRMKRLVEDLLSLSRMGREDLKYEPVDCSALVDQVTANLKPLVEEGHAGITRDPLPTIMASDILLGQVFQNLIGNAVKFRGTEPPRVHISATKKSVEWEFAVKDNGIGIEKEYVDRIFLIFQRLHSRAEYPGTGIGLAMCRKIVDRYGGRIWVESEPGKGTTVFFTIPMQDKRSGKREES